MEVRGMEVGEVREVEVKVEVGGGEVRYQWYTKGNR